MRLLLTVFALTTFLFAQQLGWVRYPVAYSIEKMGYPPVKFAPIEGGRFFYVEYWPEGPGKAVDGYYLQSVKPQMVQGGEEYVEAWAVPVKNANDPFLSVREVHATPNSVAVIGRTEVKNEATIVQFFDMAGEKMGKQLFMSPYRKNLGNYKDYFYYSANGEMIGWLGYNPDETAKKRTYYGAVYDDKGTKLWAGELNLPEIMDRRIVADAAVDSRGNMYFALIDESPTGTDSDKEFLPVILRYDWKTKEWTKKKLEIEGTCVPDLQLHTTTNEELLVVAMVMKGESGVPNRLNASGKKLHWTDVAYRKLNMLSSDLAEQGSFQEPVPAKFVERYKGEEDGAQFNEFDVIIDNDQFYLLMEQSYEKLKTQGKIYLRKDVGMLSIGLKTHKMNWMSFVEKSQSDYGNSRISYTPAITEMFVHLVYMSDVGGDGKLMVSSVNRETGEHLDKEIVENRSGNLFFFTKRSVQTEPGRLLLLGLGDPKRNEYTLTHLKGLP